MGSIWSELGSSILLFALIYGMSATVDINNLRTQLRNKAAILTGIFLQFIILPFLGFAVVKALNLSHAMGITLLVVTSSPGGSYSNWWCSMFNADLALSVTMTAISTLMSIIFLPMNLILYAKYSYNDDVISNVDWVSLFIALGVVIFAISLGLYSSATMHSPKFNIYCNRVGNMAGLALIIFSVVVSDSGENNDNSLWDRDWKFYTGVSTPCVLGLALSNMISTYRNLQKPERVTVSVECCYQNTGIATSVAISMFKGEELAEAVGVPLFYGLVEAVVLGLYCVYAWKIGWTKAPKDESFCVVVSTSYEVQKTIHHDITAIEVVLGPKNNNDLVLEVESNMSEAEEDSSVILCVSYPPSRSERKMFPVSSCPSINLDFGINDPNEFFQTSTSSCGIDLEDALGMTTHSHNIIDAKMRALVSSNDMTDESHHSTHSDGFLRELSNFSVKRWYESRALKSIFIKNNAVSCDNTNKKTNDLSEQESTHFEEFSRDNGTVSTDLSHHSENDTVTSTPDRESSKVRPLHHQHHNSPTTSLSSKNREESIRLSIPPADAFSKSRINAADQNINVPVSISSRTESLQPPSSSDAKSCDSAELDNENDGDSEEAAQKSIIRTEEKDQSSLPSIEE